MTSVVVRVAPVVFSDAPTVTVPFPVPLPLPTMMSQPLPPVVLHPQEFPVDTVIDVVPPPAGTDTDGVTAYTHVDEAAG